MPISDPNHPLFTDRGQVVLTTTGSVGLNHRRVSASGFQFATATIFPGVKANSIFRDDTELDRFYLGPMSDMANITFNPATEFAGDTVGQQSFSLTCVLTSSAYLNKIGIKSAVGFNPPSVFTIATAENITPAVEVIFGGTHANTTENSQLIINTSSLQLDSLPASGALYISKRKNFPNTLTSDSDTFHTLHFTGSTVHAPTSAISGTLVPISLSAAKSDGNISGSDLANALRDAVNNNIVGLTASAHLHFGQAHTLIKGDEHLDSGKGTTLQDCTTFNNEDTASINVTIDGNWDDKVFVSNATGGTTFYQIPQPTVNPKKYRAFRINFGRPGTAAQQFTDDNTDTFMCLDQIRVFTIQNFGAYSFDNEYNVEFDDSLLSLQGYTNARFEGTKLKSFAVNQFVDKKANPATALGTFPVSGFDTGSNFNGWGGDITYGKNPLITSKINAIFLGKSLTDGEEDTNLVQIDGHSYATIDKILLINTETDEIQIISSENTGIDAFKKFVTDNFSEGSKCNFKLFESQEGFSNISQKLKPLHKVKFNDGMLMRVYTYTPDTTGTEDGVVGGFGLKHHNDVTDESPVAGFANNLGRSNDGTEARPGGGLFSFGTTAIESASLFSTNSIDFVNVLPEELSTYSNDINLTIAGEIISDVSSSYIIVPFTPGEIPSLEAK
jgi:hypothetical protein